MQTILRRFLTARKSDQEQVFVEDLGIILKLDSKDYSQNVTPFLFKIEISHSLRFWAGLVNWKYKSKTMKKLSQKDKEKIMGLRAQFPKKLDVLIHRCEDGVFAAKINNYQGCNTQGRTISELIEMVNDCLYCYFDVPLKYLSFMPTYLPSFSIVAGFDFLQKTSETDINADFKIIVGANEKVAV